MSERTVVVWDIPVRTIHWVLVILVAGAFATGLVGGNWMVWHGRLGIAILFLLTFRILWGFFGSTYARFSTFIRGPRTLLQYLRGQWQGYGHNPFGALSVIALLSLLLLQALTGLFTNDDIAFRGPLHDLVGRDWSQTLTSIHRLGIWWLGGLILLHISAIAAYRILGGKNLVIPMVTGRTPIHQQSPLPITGGNWLALLLSLALAAAVTWIANGGLIPTPPPAPPSIHQW